MSAILFDKRHYCWRLCHGMMFQAGTGGDMAARVMVEPLISAINEVSTVASLHSVTKRFGRQTALDRFSLDLRAGEVVALLGPNGAGKAAAVRLRLGLSQATSG